MKLRIKELHFETGGNGTKDQPGTLRGVWIAVAGAIAAALVGWAVTKLLGI
jgi:hypothetical protein